MHVYDLYWSAPIIGLKWDKAYSLSFLSHFVSVYPINSGAIYFATLNKNGVVLKKRGYPTVVGDQELYNIPSVVLNEINRLLCYKAEAITIHFTMSHTTHYCPYYVSVTDFRIIVAEYFSVGELSIIVDPSLYGQKVPYKEYKFGNLSALKDYSFYHGSLLIKLGNRYCVYRLP